MTCRPPSNPRGRLAQNHSSPQKPPAPARSPPRSPEVRPFAPGRTHHKPSVRNRGRRRGRRRLRAARGCAASPGAATSERSSPAPRARACLSPTTRSSRDRRPVRRPCGRANSRWPGATTRSAARESSICPINASSVRLKRSSRTASPLSVAADKGVMNSSAASVMTTRTAAPFRRRGSVQGTCRRQFRRRRSEGYARRRAEWRSIRPPCRSFNMNLALLRVCPVQRAGKLFALRSSPQDPAGRRRRPAARGRIRRRDRSTASGRSRFRNASRPCPPPRSPVERPCPRDAEAPLQGRRRRRQDCVPRPRPARAAQVLGDPRADHRLGRRPHVQFRIELSRDAFDDDLVFCSMTSSTRVVISKRAVMSKSSVKSFAIEI